MRIVIVEDEKNIREELLMLLKSTGYEAEAVLDFQNTVSEVIKWNPDLVLLDINLPGQNGQVVCKELREKQEIPVIFLTSDDRVITEVDSMLAGADDFITKPYHPSVLLARISAVLKRNKKHTEPESYQLVYRKVTLDIRTYKAYYGGNQIELSKNEFKLLHYLFQRKEEIVSRLDIIEYLWDNEVFIDDNALSVTVTRIRNKLEQIGAAGFIETKRGLGYKI